MWSLDTAHSLILRRAPVASGRYTIQAVIRKETTRVALEYDTKLTGRTAIPGTLDHDRSVKSDSTLTGHSCIPEQLPNLTDTVLHAISKDNHHDW